MSRSTQKRLKRRIDCLYSEIEEGYNKSSLTINALENTVIIKFLELCVREDKTQAQVFKELIDCYQEKSF